jgi:hypothetical protein
VAIVAFMLTWLLREVPLRQTASADGIGESFASPRDASSERELERIVSSIVRGNTRARIYRQMTARAGLELSLAEAWLLGRLRGRTPTTVPRLAGELGVPAERVAALAQELERRGLVSNDTRPIDLTAEGATRSRGWSRPAAPS